MKPRLVLPPVLLLAASLWSPAAGQRIESPYRFVEHRQGAGLFGAMLWPAEGRLGLGPGEGAGLGLRYGIAISGPLAVELDAVFAPTTRAVVDTSFSTPDSVPVVKGDADVGLLIATGSIRFNITGGRTWRGLQPFLLFGAGVATDLAGKSAVLEEVAADVRLDLGTSFAGQLGAGMEWYPTQRWTVRVDARNAIWKLKNPTAFRLGERGRLVPPDEWEGNSIVTAGLSLRF